MFYFGPYVLPVYSYDPRTNDVIDETSLAMSLFSTLGSGILWGISMGIFLDPISTGVSVACFFFSIVAVCFATAMSFIPLQVRHCCCDQNQCALTVLTCGQLGKFANLLDKQSVADASNAARQMFGFRQAPIDLEFKDWEDPYERVFGKNKVRHTNKRELVISCCLQLAPCHVFPFDRFCFCLCGAARSTRHPSLPPRRQDCG